MGSVNWQYDEMKQVGVDYTNSDEIEAYDNRMGKLRNVKKEAENIIDLLGIGQDDVVIEFGTGTGEFALEVATRCKKVVAIDASPKMLEFAGRKSRERELNNIEFRHSGFLTYEHSEEPVDFIVSQLALHHLPDFWKMIALKNIFGLLKEGGTFYLKDTVYSFDIDGYKEFFAGLISGIKQLAGDELALDTQMAIKEEFETVDWIMEEIIKRAGFKIERVKYQQGFLAEYVCKK